MPAPERRQPRPQAFSFLALAFLATSLLAAAAFPPGALAQGKLSREDEQLLTGLANRYKGLQTLKAEYIRSTVSPSTDAVFKNQASQTAVGTLYWRKPYSLRLDQLGPEKEEMVVDGTTGTAWWYIPKEKTAHVYRDLELDSEFFALMSFFDGVDELKKNFVVSALPEGEARGALKGFVFTPTGNRTGGPIVIFCDKVPKLQGFRISSETGERTDFYLNYLSPNASLAPTLFDFKPPKGTEVIEGGAE
jgi:outer membrane lipoprotein-sorting protein